MIDSQLVKDAYPLKRGWKVVLDEEQEDVEAGEVIATRGEKELVIGTGGRVIRGEEGITVAYDEREEREYEIPSSSRLLVSEGEVLPLSILGPSPITLPTPILTSTAPV